MQMGRVAALGVGDLPHVAGVEDVYKRQGKACGSRYSDQLYPKAILFSMLLGYRFTVSWDKKNVNLAAIWKTVVTVHARRL